MTNAELIAALRWCADEDKICTEQTNCGYYGKGFFCQDVLLHDAADAIEADEARIAELEADKKTLINVVKDKSEFRATKDAMRIAELEAQLPKEGEWKPLKGMQPPELHGKHYCSNCDHIIHLALNGGVYNYCPNCGAKMDGKEKQNG